MSKEGLRKRIGFGVLLILLSVLCYTVHYLLFHDAHHIFIYFVGDVAFVFIEVLLVTLIIHNLLEHREKRAMIRKLNMVIGAFFSETGTELLGRFRDFDSNSGELTGKLVVDNKWTEERFDKVSGILKGHKYAIKCGGKDLVELKEVVVGKRGFLLGLLQNPNLLEHDSFTELLWAVFHLAEELSYRDNLEGSGEKDIAHLCGDIKRVYRLLVREWLDHMEHLKNDYPYLFSLSIRTNPFDPEASVYVDE